MYLQNVYDRENLVDLLKILLTKILTFTKTVVITEHLKDENLSNMTDVIFKSFCSVKINLT